MHSGRHLLTGLNVNRTKTPHRQLASDTNPNMYTNTESKREIKDSHSMLLPKLWELMAMRKQLPAPRKKSITFVGITVTHQVHETRARHEFTYSTFTVDGTWYRRRSQSCVNRPAPGLTDGQLFHLWRRVSLWKRASIFSTHNPNALHVRTSLFPHTLAKANEPLQTCSSWFLWWITLLSDITVYWDPYEKGWYWC